VIRRRFPSSVNEAKPKAARRCGRLQVPAGEHLRGDRVPHSYTHPCSLIHFAWVFSSSTSATTRGRRPGRFKATAATDITSGPGYQFRHDQSLEGVEQSAAGRGTLRTGRTLKDIATFNSGLASQEYGNVYNRRFREYDMNYDNLWDTYTGNRGFAFEVEQAKYQPKFANWQTQAAAARSAGDQTFARMWDVYLQKAGAWDDTVDDVAADARFREQGY
jgi:hypothetical protein